MLKAPMEFKEIIQQEVGRRRTFAIISHPDAGKTTLTEKWLLYSGAIHTAGMVKGRKGRKAAASDWMAMEQERGISITSSAIQLSYKETIINILDTPGHEDFSEDTYRTLTAADCAIMVIDASKGVEKQTRKLFEVCRLRKIPVLTFINKMDMPGKNPLDLMHEVEEVLQIHSSAINWPVGSGKEFQGVVDRQTKEVLLFTKMGAGGALRAEISRVPLASFEASAELQEEINLLEMAGNPYNREGFLSGELTPVFFGSALTNFGLEPFFDAFLQMAPPPHACEVVSDKGQPMMIDPVADPFSGYVFKLQSNMDRRHRDSMAFIRICSGRFEKDIVVKHHRKKMEVRLSRPHSLLAGERTTVDFAYPGDVIGVINPHLFAIGDTLSVSGGFSFKPLPQFQPEIFAKLYPKEMGKRKSFDKGVLQLVEEGAIQQLESIKRPGELIYAAVGRLQFEVMQYRLKDEYGVDTQLTPLAYQCSAWIVGDLKQFEPSSHAELVRDALGFPMILFRDTWDKQDCMRQNPQHELVDIRPC